MVKQGHDHRAADDAATTAADAAAADDDDAAADANDDNEQHQVPDSQLGGRRCLRVRDSEASFGGTRIHTDTTPATETMTKWCKSLKMTVLRNKSNTEQSTLAASLQLNLQQASRRAEKEAKMSSQSFHPG